MRLWVCWKRSLTNWKGQQETYPKNAQWRNDGSEGWKSDVTTSKEVQERWKETEERWGMEEKWNTLSAKIAEQSWRGWSMTNRNGKLCICRIATTVNHPGARPGTVRRGKARYGEAWLKFLNHLTEDLWENNFGEILVRQGTARQSF